jgi:hypothetical protein
VYIVRPPEEAALLHKLVFENLRLTKPRVMQLALRYRF